uniref:Uncharacterized protein n=1 Tax=Myotis myotis TaxID=51298 RepID=A0A7J8ALL4_MYOMY|nr:hypothetical protein mMyoMyo1_007871 [Myotis myotis]
MAELRMPNCGLGTSPEGSQTAKGHRPALMSCTRPLVFNKNQLNKKTFLINNRYLVHLASTFLFAYTDNILTENLDTKKSKIITMYLCYCSMLNCSEPLSSMRSDISLNIFGIFTHSPTFILHKQLVEWLVHVTVSYKLFPRQKKASLLGENLLGCISH